MTRGSRARLLPSALAALLLAGTAAPATATTIVGAGAGAIVPGSVGRTSLALKATYSTTLRLDFGDRSFDVHSAATILNNSGGPIDRVELNTVAARLGGMRLLAASVDGTPVSARVDDQTIIVPLGGILPAGASAEVRVRYAATLRTSLSGSSWLFTKANGIVNAYRWLPWVSRRTAFDRPNHGDPFVTPSSARVRLTVITDRKLVLATSGERVSVSPDGLTQVFEATDVRDMTVSAAPDFRTTSTIVNGTTIRYYYRSSANAAAIRDAAADAFRKLEFRLGDYPYPTFRVVQSAGGYGMESPRLIWIPSGSSTANLRYLVAHETAHQWFYGLVGNDQSRHPFADEAAADFAARFVTGTTRSSRCPTGRLDLSIYGYSSGCYYERVYIQGGNLLDQARRLMGSDLFWTTIRRYLASHRHGLVTTETLLEALDAATPVDLQARLFAARFPSIY